ncbi:hypothetical protein BKD30_13705 [Tersicoccus phoenicis]|uniref:Uncharacterized protein n=1 Tax=Tersicoccus phoenicis TaxID=554083 RepID=A0A1R1L6L7_9MICC|nr:hypothetical protein BKD30_13705 [Tersicoccus phoenicis]
MGLEPGHTDYLEFGDTVAVGTREARPTGDRFARTDHGHFSMRSRRHRPSSRHLPGLLSNCSVTVKTGFTDPLAGRRATTVQAMTSAVPHAAGGVSDRPAVV